MHKHTNALIHESSPYLLQHAHNPVDWHPWSEAALEKARKENKPVLVSIGYAACHWCHVMERESFENEVTAAYMNEHFINIKIDREERPDLDHIYMDAVQAMTGSGGWPLNVFLTPEAKPFYGGTYYPPQRAYNRPSWLEVLENVSDAFQERRHEIDAQAENLTAHLLQANQFGLSNEPADGLFTPSKMKQAAENCMRSADTEWGGFGRAPKFPQTFTIRFLLRHDHSFGHPEGKAQALLSIDKMCNGGLYDQLGGGFARYSTDTEWLVPHFEKMLYDNALLVSVISEAYQITGKRMYMNVMNDTIAFVQRELMHPDGGFYAALDADSEGVEGKFYTWDYKEVMEALGDEGALFCRYYDITPRGNWNEGHPGEKGNNIPRVLTEAPAFAESEGIGEEELRAVLQRGREKLMAIRDKRIRPGLDDKVILGWNALMNTALSHTYAATGKKEFLDLAIRNMEFLLREFAGDDGRLKHTWKDGKAKYPAFLDDQAYLIQALLQLSEVSADLAWLRKAEALAGEVQSQFREEGGPCFYYTPAGQPDIIVRKKEMYDGAQPSGNAVMAQVLWHLGLLLDNPEWREQSRKMLATLGEATLMYPTSFGNWASLLLEGTAGTEEIAVVGNGAKELLPELLKEYIPNRVIQVSDNTNDEFPLLQGKKTTVNPAIFKCSNYTCLAPVFSVKDLMLLKNKAPQHE